MARYELVCFALAAAAGVTWILTLGVIRMAPPLGLLDHPNERSSHDRAIPRGGGVAIVLVALLAVLGLSVLSSVRSELVTVAGAAFFVALVSLRDDFHSLSAGSRLACHSVAAAAAMWGLGSFRQIALPGVGCWDAGYLGTVLTFVWIVGLTNAYNFMDGVDGIAGSQGLVAGLAWATAGWLLDIEVLTLLGAVLAGSCVGFLVLNWSPARVFMGDVGSAFLGFTFSVLPLLAVREMEASRPMSNRGLLPAFGLLVVWPFVADSFVTFCRRVRNRERLWMAHRSHFYQRLVRRGFGHGMTSRLYSYWAAASAVVALLWLVQAPAIGPLAVVVSAGTAFLALVLFQERA